MQFFLNMVPFLNTYAPKHINTTELKHITLIKVNFAFLKKVTSFRT
jgi:hypothetical protein